MRRLGVSVVMCVSIVLCLAFNAQAAWKFANEIALTKAYNVLYGTTYDTTDFAGLAALVEDQGLDMKGTWTAADVDAIQVLVFDTSVANKLYLKVGGDAYLLYNPGPWQAPSQGWLPETQGSEVIDIAELLAMNGHDPQTTSFSFTLNNTQMNAANTYLINGLDEGEFMFGYNDGGLGAGDRDANEPIVWGMAPPPKPAIPQKYLDRCPEGANIIIGTNEADELVGTDGDDCIFGRGGDDVILAGDGNDTVRGGAGDDVVDGGAGDDVIRGGSGNDSLHAGAGDDDARGNAGDDMIEGGLGHDSLYGGRDNDTIVGGFGDDMIRGGGGDDELYGEAGSDDVRGRAGSDYVDGGDGDDVVRGGTGNDLVRGGDGDDFIRGGKDHDICEGGWGEDNIRGGAGDDVLYGGAVALPTDASESVSFTVVSDAATTLLPQETPAVATWADHPYWSAVSMALDDATWVWNSELVTEPGVNEVQRFRREITLPDPAYNVSATLGFSSDNSYILWVNGVPVVGSPSETNYFEVTWVELELGPGTNAIEWEVENFGQPWGNAYTNPAGLIYAIDVSYEVPVTGDWGVDDDTISGGSGADQIYGGPGDDRLSGGSGGDQVFGESGDDSIRGGSGDDELHGDNGMDAVYGRSGKDVLYGGAGADKLKGGADPDVCLDTNAKFKGCESIEVEF